MQITEISLKGLCQSFQIIIPSEDIVKAVNARIHKIGQTVQLPGFRKGKVPLVMLKQRYGQAALGEVIEDQVEENVKKSLTQRKVRPALKPKVTIDHFEEGKDLVINVSLEALPEIGKIEIGGFDLENLKVDVTSEKIEETLKELREKNPVPVALEKPRPIQNNDVVYLTYTVTFNKKETGKKEGKNSPYLVGSNFFGAAFDDVLKKSKIGETASAEISFPEGHHEDVTEKNAHIEFTIQDVMELKAPALEEFAEILKFEDIASLKKNVQESLAENYEHSARQHMKRQILDHLARLHSFEVPSCLVDLEFESIWKEREEYEQEKNPKGSKLLTKEEEADLKKEYRDIGERRVRLGLLLADIGLQHGVTVTNTELGQAIYEYAQNYPGHEKEIMEYYKKNPNATAAFQAPIFEEKVIDFIIGKSNLRDRSVTEEELLKILNEDEDEIFKVEDSSETPSKKSSDTKPKKSKETKEKSS